MVGHQHLSANPMILSVDIHIVKYDWYIQYEANDPTRHPAWRTETILSAMLISDQHDSSKIHTWRRDQLFQYLRACLTRMIYYSVSCLPLTRLLRCHTPWMVSCPEFRQSHQYPNRTELHRSKLGTGNKSVHLWKGRSKAHASTRGEPTTTSQSEDPPSVNLRRVILHGLILHNMMEETHDCDRTDSQITLKTGDVNWILIYNKFKSKKLSQCFSRIKTQCPSRPGQWGSSQLSTASS